MSTVNRHNEKASGTSVQDRIVGAASAFYAGHRRAVDLTLLALLFAACFFVRLNNICHKTQLHSDEVFSMMISTCNPYYNEDIPDGDYTGAELKRMVAVSGEGGVKGAAADISRLWVNNGDSPHASLYYMALRLALIGYDDFDVHDFAMRGGILNLLFFALSFVLMYKLLREIFGSRSLLVLAGMTVAFCNVLSIQNTMLIREYQMAEAAAIALTLFAVRLAKRLREGGDGIEWRKVVAELAVAVGCLISLGYFNAVYVAALGLCLLACCARRRCWKGAGLVLLAGVAGVAIAYLLYPGYFNFLLHPTVHKSMAFRNFPLSFQTVFARDIPRYMFYSYGLWIVGATIVVGLLSRRGLKTFLTGPYFGWLPLVVMVCMPLILYASVLKHPRYYYSILPILTLIIPQLLAGMSVLWRRYFGMLIVLFFPVVISMLTVSSNYGWEPLSAELSKRITFYKLNPNELAQLVPCLTDGVSYTVLNGEPLESVMAVGEKRAVVAKTGKWSGSDFVYVGRLIWNKNIYIFDIEHVSAKNGE